MRGWIRAVVVVLVSTVAGTVVGAGRGSGPGETTTPARRCLRLVNRSEATVRAAAYWGLVGGESRVRAERTSSLLIVPADPGTVRVELRAEDWHLERKVEGKGTARYWLPEPERNRVVLKGRWDVTRRRWIDLELFPLEGNLLLSRQVLESLADSLAGAPRSEWTMTAAGGRELTIRIERPAARNAGRRKDGAASWPVSVLFDGKDIGAGTMTWKGKPDAATALVFRSSKTVHLELQPGTGTRQVVDTSGTTEVAPCVEDGGK